MPAEAGSLGRVYFGFDNLSPQGGMNEKGLFFDGFATKAVPVTNSRYKKRFDWNLLDRVMAECSTVAEVIAEFEKYNLEVLEKAMLFYADRYGDSVIIEGDHFVRKTGRYQICTNFHQSQSEPEKVTCRRYRAADAILSGSEEISIDLFSRILHATHVEGPAYTLYSNICDLTNGTIHLYLFHDFENVVVLDLKEELKKGRRIIDIPSLFPDNSAWTTFQQKQRKEMKLRRKELAADDIDPATFDQYVGRYEAVLESTRVHVDILLENGKLFVVVGDHPKSEVLASGADRFFHASPETKRVYHAHHRGHAHTPIIALAALCRTLPEHPDWIQWYSCVVYYSEYLKTLAAYTEPYGVFPASLYRDDEYLQIPEKPPRSRFAGYAGPTRESFRQQVLNGVDMGGEYYLRRFPVWFMIRGHFGVLLTKTKALSTAARLRGDLEAVDLAERQLQWIVGCNPFSQSTMYGEGYDYVPHYSAMSGQIVGSLPVGIETLLDHDAPYWPVHNHMNTKETWVYPVAHWMSVLADLGWSTLAMRKTASGGGGVEVTRTIDGRSVVVNAKVTDEGVQSLEIRGENLRCERPERRLEPANGEARTVTWRATVQATDTPWVAVIIPDKDVSKQKEVVAYGR
jgi:hypothetical protein